MTKTCTKIVIAFIVGQLVQIVFNVVAKVSYMSKPIAFSAAAGFILLVTLFAGMHVANLEKPPEKKTYMDYAKGINEE